MHNSTYEHCCFSGGLPGFHDTLAKSVLSGKTYEEIVEDYDDQIGFEGRAILKVLIAKRDRDSKNDAS